MVDEFTRECLGIRVERRLQSKHVLEVLGNLFVTHGVPDYIHISPRRGSILPTRHLPRASPLRHQPPGPR
jgi:hypothetical protein